MKRLAVCLAIFLAAAAPLAAGKPPSFVVIFTDDQRWDALGFVNPLLQTPHLDALAADGIYFPNAFVTTAICPASRATLLTGLHERTHHFTFYTPPLALEFTAASHPTLLRAAGYRTAMIGKNGAVFEAGAVAEMFDVFVPLSRLPSYFKEQKDGSLRHLTDITGDHVEEFLASQDPGQPFSLWITFNAPHAQYVRIDEVPDQYFEWPQRFDPLYEDVTFPTPPTYDPSFLDTQPEFLQTAENHVRGEVLWTPPEYQQNLRGYYRMIAGIDDVVGRVRTLLDTYGLAQDTVIVFLSDNGYFIGERGGYSGKWLPHEPSIRVPMIVYDPRLDASRRGTVRQEVVLNLDVAPTLLDLAGVAVPPAMQGRSLAPLILSGGTPEWRQDIFVEHLMDPLHPPDNFPIPRHEGVRTVDGWKYAHYFDHAYEELYYLPDDPWEEDNLVEDPDAGGMLEQLRERTVELRDLYAGVVFEDGFESGDLAAWNP
jgi:arylsulfatase A-like enzyme